MQTKLRGKRFGRFCYVLAFSIATCTAKQIKIVLIYRSFFRTNKIKYVTILQVFKKALSTMHIETCKMLQSISRIWASLSWLWFEFCGLKLISNTAPAAL